ncbi:MAG: hypothetical protein K0Q52_155 [Microbacterium sp.]|jgi:hypothetical protein|nr:hypothetical protein [Microbacterium sp.]
MRTHDFENGKYTLQQNDEEHGQVTVLRHGEPWREFVGDKFIYQLVSAFFDILAPSPEAEIDAMGQVIWNVSRRDEGTISVTGARIVAKELGAQGFSRRAADAASVQTASIYRDIAASLMDWDVVYGHEPSTPEIEASHSIAAWLVTRADALEEQVTPADHTNRSAQ